jgi:hypothetical protein
MSSKCKSSKCHTNVGHTMLYLLENLDFTILTITFFLGNSKIFFKPKISDSAAGNCPKNCKLKTHQYCSPKLTHQMMNS